MAMVEVADHIGLRFFIDICAEAFSMKYHKSKSFGTVVNELQCARISVFHFRRVQRAPCTCTRCEWDRVIAADHKVYSVYALGI